MIGQTTNIQRWWSSSAIIFLVLILTRFTIQTPPQLPSFEDLDINDDFNVDNIDTDADIGSGGVEEPSVPGIPLQREIGGMIKAVALIRGPRGTYGIINMAQVGIGPTLVSGFIGGLYPFSLHGFHVHEHAVVNGDCESAGEHYNPTQETHGSPHTIRSHVGDLGNVHADGLGVARFHITSQKLSLRGKFSVINRALVVHERPDDLGMGYNRESLKSGNSGGRLGCGTIKFVSIG